jgi:hypothetical protein
MDVPPHLLHPQAGGWPTRQAAGIWAWLSYGITPTAPDTTEVTRIRRQALGEVMAIATPAPAGAMVPPRITIRRRPSAWFGDRGEEREPIAVPPADWVTQAALADLCARHGVAYGQAPTPTVAALAPAPGREGRQAATGGRPSTNAAAYDFIHTLVAEGLDQKTALAQAANKFPSPGTDVVTRVQQLRAGYRQRQRNKPS